jgi:hypothetical protein
VTPRQWLDAREPAPPEPLRADLRTVLSDGAADGDIGEVMLTRGTALLERIVRGNASSRECARDLLAADALVTYSFEAAGEAPSDLAERAREALHRISALGAEHTS